MAEISPRLTNAWKITLRVAGLLLIVYEGVVRGTERPTLLILYAAMVGLPAFVNADQKRNGSAAPPEPTSPKVGGDPP